MLKLKQVIQPLVGEFLLDTVLAQAGIQIGEIDSFQILILVVARVDKVFFAGVRIDVFA